MNLPDIVQSYRARRAQLNRERATRNYDALRLNSSTRKNIGQIKADRLIRKNARRASNGLPPRADYAAI